MQKLTEVINTMINNGDEIQNVQFQDNEYYFQFRSHVFSCHRGVAEKLLEESSRPFLLLNPSMRTKKLKQFKLYVYPNERSPAVVASKFKDDPTGNNVTFKAYTSVDLQQKLESLYSKLEEKDLGIETIFDNILKP